MKNLNSFILAFFLTFSIVSFSQGNGNQQWKINGNIANEFDYIGTKNEIPLKFKTTDIERFRVTPDGLFGIGTSAPEAKLDVNGDVIFREHVTLKNLGQSNGLDNSKLIVADGDGVINAVSVQDLSKKLISETYGKPEQGCSDGTVSYLPIWHHGENKLFVKCPEVFIGIATDKPRVNLDNLGTTYSRNLVLGNANPSQMGGKYFYLKTHDELASFEKIFQIENSNEELLSVNNQGLLSSIGIHNIGNITNTGAFINTGNATINGLTTSNGKFNLKSQLPVSNTDKIFTLANDDAEVFTVLNNGQTITYQLHNLDHFQNDGNFVNLGIFTNIGETRLNGEIILKGETTSEKNIKIHAYLDNSSEKLFEIENNQQQLMTVDNNGLLTARRIVINNTNVASPAFVIENDWERLMQVDNAGLLKARRIIVDQTEWYDHVFEKDYKLPTLYEVERYINEHKHLPNIPSEAEVKENGNDLAKMNALLLQKIEELTLHAIQQQKELDEIKKILLEKNKK